MSRKTRKLIWSAPLVAVFAVVGALALFVALSPNGAQADHVDLPGIVLDVTATADGRSAVDVTWKAPEDGGTPDYYRIDRSSGEHAGDVWMRLVQMHTGADLSISDMDGIKPGTAYHYRVFAVNVAGTGPSSDLSEHSMATTDGSVRPGAVRMLTATVDGPNQINLSWYPPEDNGGSNITRYCIATAGATGDDTADTDGVLPVPDSAIPPQFPATNGSDNPCAHNTPPTDATKLTAIRADNGAGVIVIRAPMGDGKVSYMHTKLMAQDERRYEVYAVNANGISTSASAAAPIPQTADAGKPGAPKLRLVPGGTTTNDVFVPDGNASLYWTWPDNGGADIARWQLQMREDSGEWTDVGDATGDDLATGRARDGAEYSVTGGALNPTDATATDRLMTKTTRYQVRACNPSCGAWSNTVAITIRSTHDGTSESKSTANTGMVAGLEISSGEHLRQIDLSWTDQAGTSYLIDFAETAGDATPDDDTDLKWQALQPNTGYTRSTYNHSVGLDPGVQRHYRVMSLKGGTYGPIAVDDGSTKAATKPAAVRGLMTSSDDPTKIKLDWDKPTENGGESITGYRVEISLNNTLWPESLSTAAPPTAVTHSSESCTATETSICVREVEGADNTTYTLGGLDAGDVRWFRVFAINKVSRADATAAGAAVGDFPDTNDARVATPKEGKSAESGTPGVPLDLTVQPARDANEDDPAKLGIDILWNAPDDPAGDEVTGYEIARRTKDSTDAAWSDWDADWGTISTEGSDFLRTYFTDTDEPDNLANGEMREYRVTAKSGAGSGPTTDAVVYPVDTSHAPLNAAPEPVGMIDDMMATEGDAASTMDVMGYFSDADNDMLTYSAMSDDTAVATAMISGSMLTVTFEGEGTATITVTATDMDGSGMSAMQTFMVTVEAAPMELMAPMITRTNPVGSGIVLVSWDSVAGATGYSLIATNLTDPSAPTRTAAADADDVSGQIQNLTPGDEYLIFVGVFNADLEFELSDFVKITAE